MPCSTAQSGQLSQVPRRSPEGNEGKAPQLCVGQAWGSVLSHDFQVGKAKLIRQHFTVLLQSKHIFIGQILHVKYGDIVGRKVQIGVTRELEVNDSRITATQGVHKWIVLFPIAFEKKSSAPRPSIELK